MRRALTLPLALVAAPAPLAGQQPVVSREVAARIDSVFAPWNGTASPGCALGVARDGKLIYERGYGMANLETGQAITPSSIFHVASISKQFAAAAVALLADRGRLSLEDDIRIHVPEIPAYQAPITIRQLMQHTSGLRDQWALLRLAGWRGEDLITEDDVMWVVPKQRALNFTPGSEFLYSNTGYTLLAVIVKRVTGLSLREFADREFFQPLGMRHTHFHDDHGMVVPGRTSAYVRGPDGAWRVSIPDFDTYGATSLFTTVGDLLTWQRNFTTALVLSPGVLAEMQQTPRLPDGTESSYGLGVAMGTHRGLRTVGHSGADHGYRADVVRFTDHDLSVAAFCNLGPINPSQLTRRVGEILLAEHLAPEPPRPTAVAVSRDELARWTGAWHDEVTDEVRRLVLRGDTLALQPGPALVPLGNGRFVTPDGQVTVTLSEAANGVAEMVAAPPGARVARYRRMPPFAPDTAQLRRYAGTYASTELDTRYTVAVGDSGLELRRPKFAPVRLAPVFPDAFTLSDIGALLTFTRSRGRISGFTLTAGRVRRLTFDK